MCRVPEGYGNMDRAKKGGLSELSSVVSSFCCFHWDCQRCSSSVGLYRPDESEEAAEGAEAVTRVRERDGSDRATAH